LSSLVIKPNPKDEFNVTRRRLNVKLLIEKKAIRITYPANGKGETIEDPDPKMFTVVTYVNEQGKTGLKIRKWKDKPSSYKNAEIAINQSLPNLGKQGLIGDSKYRQIITSAKKLGLSDKDIYD